MQELVHTVTATTKRINFFLSFGVVMELVPYPFMTAMATDTIAMATEKMGIMESDDGVHTVCDGNGNGEN